MRHYSKLLPLIALPLFFCGVFLGAALTTASRGYTVSGVLPALAHTLFMLGLALWLSLHLRKHSRLPRRLSSILAVLAVLCLAASFFMPFAATPGAESGGALSWKYLMFPALCLCLCLPVGLSLFFEAVPKARQGVAVGCALAAGELLWIVVLPLLHLHVSGPGHPDAVLYLYAFLCFSIAAMAGCLSLALRGQGAFGPDTSGQDTSGPAEPDAAEPEAPAAAPRQPDIAHASPNTLVDAPSRKALLCLFAGGAFFSVLLGLALGDMPRGTGSPAFSGSLHFPLLFIAPLAGVVLDGMIRSPALLSRANYRALCLCLAAGIAAVPVIGVFTGFGFTEPLPFLLLAVRLALMTALFVVTARLAGGSPFFPLLGGLVWSLLFAQHGGIMLADALRARPGLKIAAASALALGCIVLLRRFVLAAKNLPTLWNGDEGGPDGERSAEAELAAKREAAKREAAKREAAEREAAKREQDKRLAFAAAHSLTKREAEVLAVITGGNEKADIGAALGISENTVKTHVRRLLQKTKAANRQRLVYLYAEWRPGQ